MNDKQELNQKVTKQIAESIAQEYFNKPLKEFLEDTRNDMKSTNNIKKARANATARDFTSKLILFVLYQTLDAEYDLEIYNWINYFEDERIEAGNAKQFVKTILTGNDRYAPDQFIPAKITKPLVESKVIGMYKDDGTLMEGAYQYKKPFTIVEAQWLPYFMSGKLSQFISQISQLANQSYKLFKVQLFQTILKDKTNFQYQITGTAPNMFEAFSNEIFPLISRMRFFNSEFALGNGVTTPKYEVNTTAKKEDILMFLHVDNETKLSTGIQSKLFNAQLIDIKSYINSENIIPCDKMLVIGDSDTAITTNEDFIAKTDVVVITKKAIRHLFQVSREETQQWAENMTIQNVLHVWACVGMLPWEKAFFYTNPNLGTLPTTKTIREVEEVVKGKNKKPSVEVKETPIIDGKPIEETIIDGKPIEETIKK